jgi:phenylacetate-CoA ligase
LYIEAIADFAPAFLHGYPSSLAVLARFMLKTGCSDVRPRAVFTASETLLDIQRMDIEQAFGTKVYNWYGNTELTCNIVECAAGRLHYRTDYGLLEVLPDGAMIATGLNNPAMPLIRYRIGDVAWFQEGTCPCGCEFPLIERVEGRIEDYIRTPDGRLVGRLDHLFKDATHVREAQLEQQRVEELIIRIVKADGFTEKEEAIIRHEARQRLGERIQIRFEYVSAIPRTTNGKFRFVVSGLSPASAQAVTARENGTP